MFASRQPFQFILLHYLVWRGSSFFFILRALIFPSCIRHTGYGVASIEKPPEIQQGDWASEPTEAMIRYAQEDVQYLWKLHESQMYMMRHDQMVAYTRSRNRVPELAAEYIDYEGGLHGH